MSAEAEMNNAYAPPLKSNPTAVDSAAYLRRPLWTPLIMVVLYWVAFGAAGLVNVSMFPRFLMRAAALILLMLGLMGWWFIRGPVRIAYRFLLLGWMIVASIAAMLLMHGSAPAMVIIVALPVLFTAWLLWLLASRNASERVRVGVMMAIGFLVWVPGMVVRTEGMKGDGGADWHWRWAPVAEEELLKQNSGDGNTVVRAASDSDSQPIAATAEDWTGFRGTNRDSSVSDVTTGANWGKSPPRRIWTTRVGPAWSSMTVVGGRVFTQEQRGKVEVVSCFDANTGTQIWLHTDPGRFEEPMGGIGPRGSPTFASGRIYTLGVSGRLNCLDAGNGRQIWSRDIAADSGAALPSWGFSGSPLVVDNRVFAFAGGKEKQWLMAMDATTGDILWNVPAGTESYSSPQWMVIAGKPQVLFLGDKYLGSYDPETGKSLWKFDNASAMGRPVIQPQLVSDSQLLLSFAPDQGITRIEVSRNGEQWNARELWSTRDIKPDYSDFVHHDGFLYGFDGNIFCCLDLATGKRQWKGGRYGAGQVILLVDQPLMIVVTEQGDIALVATNPKRHEEVARFEALHSKTWNHPAIAHGKLYVRNAEEMACFELSPPGS